MPTSCLPALLKKDGYHTVFLSAFWDGAFANTERFMRGIGFDDIQIGSLMRPDDRRYGWGYDDCQFYDRAFDYLEQMYKDNMKGRFFAYFVVSAAHTPFDNYEEYRPFWPFPQPRSFRETYRNAFAMQDHCVSVFLKRVQPFRDRAHVLIVADHSYPVGIQGSILPEVGATSENFLIPFLYLPPSQDRRYRRGAVMNTPVPGQADIFPTLLELLGGRSYPNSFAPLLRTDRPGLPADYDDCQIATQPYDGLKVTVVRGRNKLTYEAASRQLLASELSAELREGPPRLIASGLSYPEFKARYFCDRYWRLKPP